MLPGDRSAPRVAGGRRGAGALPGLDLDLVEGDQPRKLRELIRELQEIVVAAADRDFHRDLHVQLLRAVRAPLHLPDGQPGLAGEGLHAPEHRRRLGLGREAAGQLAQLDLERFSLALDAAEVGHHLLGVADFRSQGVPLRLELGGVVAVALHAGVAGDTRPREVADTEDEEADQDDLLTFLAVHRPLPSPIRA